MATRDLHLTWAEWDQALLAPAPPAVFIPPPVVPAADPGAGIFCSTYLLHNRKTRVILHDSDLIAEIIPASNRYALLSLFKLMLRSKRLLRTLFRLNLRRD